MGIIEDAQQHAETAIRNLLNALDIGSVTFKPGVDRMSVPARAH